VAIPPTNKFVGILATRFMKNKNIVIVLIVVLGLFFLSVPGKKEAGPSFYSYFQTDIIQYVEGTTSLMDLQSSGNEWSAYPPLDTLCYQEDPTIATSCGGLSSGSYGDVTEGGAYSEFTIYYAKPPLATEAFIRLKTTDKILLAGTKEYIYPIPPTCFGDLIPIRIFQTSAGGNPSCGSAGDSSVEIICNGHVLHKLGTCTSNGNGYSIGHSSAIDGDWSTGISHYSGYFREGFTYGAAFYEEAMYWKVT
jgi:hypothetical protein